MKEIQKCLRAEATAIPYGLSITIGPSDDKENYPRLHLNYRFDNGSFDRIIHIAIPRHDYQAIEDYNITDELVKRE